MPHPIGPNIHLDPLHLSSLPLLPDERVIFDTHPSAVLLLVQIIGLLTISSGVDLSLFKNNLVTDRALLVLPLVAAAFLSLVLFTVWATTTYFVTTRRVETRSGIFTRSVRSIATRNIQAVLTKVNFIGLILRFGDVVIRSAAQEIVIQFKSIHRPFDKAEQIEAVRP